MTLQEILEATQADAYVQRLKASAAKAKDHAKQLKHRAATAAAQQKLKQSRQQLTKLSQSKPTTSIKPY